jgi:hypothetical protein
MIAEEKETSFQPKFFKNLYTDKRPLEQTIYSNIVSISRQ